MQNKTKLEIINETVAFYSEDVKRRAVNEGGSCEYRTEDGRKCAVGRVLLPRHYQVSLEGETASDILRGRGDSILFLEYRGHSHGFWDALQHFHDRHQHWNRAGLTLEGIAYKNELIQKVITNEL